MKLSIIQAIWTGFWARNCGNTQQVLILKFALGPEKFPGLSRNGSRPDYFSVPKLNTKIKI